MRCDEMSERIPEWLAGELSGDELEALREHLATCPGCAEEAQAFERLWRELGETGEDEVPSTALRGRFETLLGAAEARERRKVVPFGGRPVDARAPFSASPLLRAAALAAMLLVAVFVGSELSRQKDSRAIADLRQEVHSLHESVTLALLSESSPSERLRGVSYGREVSARDPKVAEALFEAMLQDPDVNVRLAALDALRPVAARPETQTRLAAAIPGEDSPLVQLSLIDVLLESDGAAARRDLKQLLDNPKLDPVVRGYLRDRLGRSA